MIIRDKSGVGRNEIFSSYLWLLSALAAPAAATVLVGSPRQLGTF